MNKLERIGCLYLTFLGHPGGLSFAQIREYLPDAYPTGPGEDPETSRRKFERDKDELRALGMDLKHHAAGETLPDGSLAGASMYVIAEELQRLPEIELSPGEVQTLSAVLMTALAEAAERPRAGNDGEESARALLESAAFKLLYKHPALLQNRTAPARAANTISGDPDQAPGEAKMEATPHRGNSDHSETLGMIHSALSKRRRLEILYAKKTGESKSRLVDGRGLISHRGRWCLVAHCLDSDGIRMFYVDRIAEARLSDEPARKDPGFDIQRYSLHPLALFIEAPVAVELSIDPTREDSWNDFISGLPPALLAASEDSPPDADPEEAVNRYQFHTTNPRALFAWMVRFPGAVQALGPPELRNRFVEYMALFRARYSTDAPVSGGQSA